MTASEIQSLVDFNFWARDRVLDAVSALTPDQFLQDLGSSFGSVRDTLAHIYSAEWIWLARWEGHSPTSALSFDDFPDCPKLTDAWRALEQRFRAVVAAQSGDDLTRIHEYRLLSGQPGKSVVGQMVQHVVNHGTYHRGQVTAMLRQLGATPPRSTDLITYYRETVGIRP